MRLLSVAAVLTLAAIPALADDFAALPAGPGRDVMVRVCSQCHSPEIAATQRQDRQGWKDLVAQMANNGAQASDAEFATIVQYLSTAFPAAGAAPGAPAPAATPAPAQ
ncbi:MAG TPA: hypothetical protein VG821_06040 [Rhizomicrobium sp.]|nr:hypothetical protein [Rhizomicrobium sp.]